MFGHLNSFIADSYIFSVARSGLHLRQYKPERATYRDCLAIPAILLVRSREENASLPLHVACPALLCLSGDCLWWRGDCWRLGPRMKPGWTQEQKLFQKYQKILNRNDAYIVVTSIMLRLLAPAKKRFQIP